MSKFAAAVRAFAVILVACTAMGQKGDKAFVLKEDLPHIGCQVCEIVVETLHGNVEATREAAPYKKITELTVLEEIENICDHKQSKGSWMLEYDTVQQGDALVLEKQASKGKCEHECLTLQRSCADLLDSEIDQDDLSAILWKGALSKEQLQQKVCKQWTSRCKQPTQKRKKALGQRTDYPFTPLSDRDLQMQQLMAAMGDTGMGNFDMMDRESMLEQMAGLNGDDLADMYGGGDMADMYGDMEGGYFDEL